MLMAYLEMQMLSSSLALIWAQTRSRRRRRWGNPEIATRWKSPGSSLQAPSPQATSTRYNQAYLVNAGQRLQLYALTNPSLDSERSSISCSCRYSVHGTQLAGLVCG